MAPTTPYFFSKTFRPPLPADHLPRPELLQLLHQAQARRLMLICAPAGFGKSTLAVEYCEHLPARWRSVWVGLDGRDARAGQFLRTLVQALRSLIPQLGTTELELLRQQHPEQPLALEQLMGAVLDELGELHPSDHPVLLVLDDYHLVQGPQCDRLCALLLDRLPPGFQLLLTSRQRPAWHLARLRLSNQLLELDERHLRLDSQASRLFLERAGLSQADPQWLAALLQRNEGWIAGLRLLAVAVEQDAGPRQTPPMPAPSHLVGEYLLEEVIFSQPAAVRQFLADVSWLERFTVELCDEVRQASDSSEILAHLLAHRVFLVPLDGEGRWYRFHHLFSDVLRQRAANTGSARRLTIHQRACHWFDRHGLVAEAVEHALAAERPDLAADLVQLIPLEQLLSEQPVDTMLRWKAELPVALQGSSARLVIAHAWTLALACQLEDAESMLGRLCRFLPQPDQERQRRLLGQALTLKAYLARAAGRLDEARQHAHQALACLTDQDSGSRFMAMLTLGDCELCARRLDQGRQWARNALELAQRSGNRYFEAQAILMRARLMQARGQIRRAYGLVVEQLQQLDANGRSEGLAVRARLRVYQGYLAILLGEPEALDTLQSGIDEARRSRDVHALQGYCAMAAVLARRLDTAGKAFNLLAEAERLMHQWDVPPVYYLGWVTALKSDLWMTTDRRELAEHWLPRLRQTYCKDGGAAPPPFFHALPVLIELVYARLLWQRGERVACESCLRELLGRLQRSGDVLQQQIALVHLIRLLYLDKRPEEAEQYLRQALALAEPDGLVGVFDALLQQAPTGLTEALRRAPASALRDRLLVLLPAVANPDGQIQVLGLREPLSTRELDVLRLIAQGYSNQQISEALYISLHTVKSHARRINHKLAVARRTQAVAQAKVLGLLG